MDRNHILSTLDMVEADLVRLQHHVWRVRRRLQEDWGLKVGHQYDENSHVRADDGTHERES